jgi:dTDP-4-amino-4,6-dideoxygalactose transaminase
MINISEPQIGPEERRAVEEVLTSGHLAQGPKVAAFEEAFAGFCGVEETVAVASGTEAIRLALMALGVGPGDEVVIPAFTFVATATAVLMCDGVPVVVDVDEATFNMDPVAAEAAVTDTTKAILPVHLYGQPADMGPLLDLCEERGLALVEDAAQAHGARWEGRMAGSVGAAGCFSFYPTKNMTTGEGGAVTTSDPGVATRMRLLRQHGLSGPYTYEMFGYNSRMTDMEAAVGLVQLGRLEGFNRVRCQNASRLTDGLEEVVVTPHEAIYADHVFHQYTIKADRRDELRQHLHDQGIGTGIYYPHPLTDVPILEGRMQVPSEPVVASRLSREVLSLPVHPGLSDDDVSTVATAVREFYQG